MKKFLLKFLHPLVCLGALILPTSLVKADGLIGADLETAQTKNDLFVFFNFAPVGTEKTAAGTAISYKPTGEAFRALVTLKVTADRAGKISRLQLEIARSFIDDRSKSIYAADLAKSFLVGAAKTASGDAIQSLAAEITAQAQAGSSVTILSRQAPTPVSPTPSPAYQTYAGDTAASVLTYPSGVQVQLSNNHGHGAAVLAMTVGAKQ